jgi:hypothetical protein
MANATITVLEADGTTQTDVVVLDVGRQAAAASKSVTLSTDDILADDAAFTPATSKVMPMGAFVDDTATDSVDEGDIGAPRMSADRILYVQGAVADDAVAAGKPVPVGAIYESAPPTYTSGDRTTLHTGSRGSLSVQLMNADSTTAVNVGTTSLTAVTAAGSGLRVISPMYVSNGTTIDQAVSGTGASGAGVQRIVSASDSPDVTALQVIDDWDESDRAKVNLIVGQAGVAANAGAADATTIRTVSASDDPIITAITGNVAHDAADSGNGSKIAAKAETSLKGITPVSDGDRTDLYADSDGVLMVKLNTPNADILTDAISNTDGASTASAVFTAVASTRNYITHISAFRTDTATTMAWVEVRDGTAGSILFRLPLPPAGGSSFTSASPLFKTTANTALAYDVSSALSTIYINAVGYQSKV